MIALDAANITKVDTTFGGQLEKTVITDTLRVRDFCIDFTAGTLTAVLQLGTVVDGVFAETMPVVQVTADVTGAVTLSDGRQASTVPNFQAFVAALQAQLDQFILISGTVGGAVL